MQKDKDSTMNTQKSNERKAITRNTPKEYRYTNSTDSQGARQEKNADGKRPHRDKKRPFLP